MRLSKYQLFMIDFYSEILRNKVLTYQSNNFKNPYYSYKSLTSINRDGKVGTVYQVKRHKFQQV